MEDSYTVHRRRKAAAKKREKTPDPTKRREDKESESVEEDNYNSAVARAKMEKMVQETESMIEIIADNDVNVNPDAKKVEEIKSEKVIDDDKTISNDEGKVKTVKNFSPNIEEQEDKDKLRSVLAESSSSGIDKPRDSDVLQACLNVLKIEKNQADENLEITIDGEMMKESILSDKIDDSLSQKKVVANESCSGEVNKPVAKKRSKEKFQSDVKKIYGTDSSDGEEKMIPVYVRRKKPSEDQSRKMVDSKLTKSNREKRHVSKQRYSTGTEEESSSKKEEKGRERGSHEEPKLKLREKRSMSRHRYPSDTDDDLQSQGIKKSETYPQKSQTDNQQLIKRSVSDMKKQIIPLSDDSLIQDFAKAQEDYLRRERGILGDDKSDDYSSKKTDSKILRKRKLGILHYSDPEELLKTEDNKVCVKKTSSWFSWLNYFNRKKEKIDDDGNESSQDKLMIDTPERPVNEKVTLMEFFKALKEIFSEYKAYVGQNEREIKEIKRLRNCCIGELILVIIYCGLGAFVFRFTEGAFETFYKCGVKRVKRDFLDNLWNYSHNMREDDWKSMARRKLMEFEEQLHSAHEAGVHSYSGQKSWTFLNAVSYCLTVITTIGYGHISPRTMAGQAITIIYAIFGIPIFLIILADFGKLFTRGIKFLWAFVRRLYYTGSCRTVRRTVPVQEVMKGVQLVYDFATFKRPSQINPEDVEEMQRHQLQQQQQQQTILNLDGNAPQPETPGTPAMSNFAIDDEFNLPISVAISILLGYIFVGATAYHMFEDWDFFESFYFVFISMSTIGFGDFVPKNPIFMMFSIIYLVFGLALTSMCINVVQTVLSDSFKQASQKISATIGFEVPPEEGEENIEGAGEPGVVEISDVQAAIKEPEQINEDKIAPKAKQEDVNL